MRKNYFWGLLLIFIGVVFIIKRVFYIDIPVFTSICSFALIFWGISILFDNTSRKPHSTNKHYNQDAIFTNDEIKATEFQNKYNILFSDSTVDLTSLPIPKNNRTINIDCIFSRGFVRINPDIPAKIRVSSAFASAHMPNGVCISFGDYTYVTSSYREDSSYYYIKADAVFGHMDIVE